MASFQLSTPSELLLISIAPNAPVVVLIGNNSTSTTQWLLLVVLTLRQVKRSLSRELFLAFSARNQRQIRRHKSLQQQRLILLPMLLLLLLTPSLIQNPLQTNYGNK
jgi:hypothetical protein